MKYLYSARENAFYPEGWKSLYEEAGTLPNDLKPVSEEVFVEFSLGPTPSGKMRSSDNLGNPCWVDLPPPNPDELAGTLVSYRDSLMRDASVQISTLEDAVEFGLATEEEKKLLQDLKLYRVDLIRITQVDGFPFYVEWPTKPK